MLDTGLPTVLNQLVRWSCFLLHICVSIYKKDLEAIAGFLPNKLDGNSYESYHVQHVDVVQ